MRFASRKPVSVILVEDKVGGNALLTDLRQRLPAQIKVEGIVPAEGKSERLKRVIELIRARCVFLPQHAEWREDFDAEIDEFPGGWRTDQVDAMTQFLEWTMRSPVPPPPPRRDPIPGVVVTRRSFIQSQSSGMLVGPHSGGTLGGPLGTAPTLLSLQAARGVR
jgi:predicted phage terminase large subunit-like protein